MSKTAQNTSTSKTETRARNETSWQFIELMFPELHTQIKQLSAMGILYLGHYGGGFTRIWLKLMIQKGTYAVLNEELTEKVKNPSDLMVLEQIIAQGGKWFDFGLLLMDLARARKEAKK